MLPATKLSRLTAAQSSAAPACCAPTPPATARLGLRRRELLRDPLDPLGRDAGLLRGHRRGELGERRGHAAPARRAWPATTLAMASASAASVPGRDREPLVGVEAGEVHPRRRRRRTWPRRRRRSRARWRSRAGSRSARARSRGSRRRTRGCTWRCAKSCAGSWSRPNTWRLAARTGSWSNGLQRTSRPPSAAGPLGEQVGEGPPPRPAQHRHLAARLGPACPRAGRSRRPR